jgi:beta-lactam-binding protein with PASTA domain
VAYLPVAGPAGIVLSQTPTPAAAGVDGPRISLLVSEPVPVARPRQAAIEGADDNDSTQSSADVETPPVAGTSASDAAKTSGDGTLIDTPLAVSPGQQDAYVMPNLIGLSLNVANGRLAMMGLRITSMETVPGPFRPVAPVVAPAAPGSPGYGAMRPIAPPAPVTIPNTIVSQSPAIGHRVTRTDTIHVVLNR